MGRPLTLVSWLVREHDAFRALLDEMETSLEEDPGGESFSALLGRLLPALAGHEKVERELLYPAVLEHVKPLDPRLIDLFEDSHEEVHVKLDALRAALEDRSAGIGRLVAGGDFIALLREHLEEEEQALFPLVEQRVPAAVLSDLGARASETASMGGRRR